MQSSKLSFWHKFLPPTILSVITGIIYFPSLFYIFFFDDLPTITENIHIIRESQNFWNQIYVSNRWFSKFLSKICYHFWQANPVPFRVINLLIHILTGVLIFFFVLKILGELKNSSFLQKNAYVISILASGLFLLHPFQTQTATYICQMQLEGGMTLLIFLVLITFVYAAKTLNLYFKAFLYFLSAVFVSVSAGTKEAVIVLPFLILITDWFFVAQGDWCSFRKRILIHLMLVGVFFVTLEKLKWNPLPHLPTTIKQATTSAVENNRGNIITATAEEKITPPVFFISQFKIILHYLMMYFWPVGICFDYELRLSYNLSDFDVLFPLLLLLTLLALALFLFIKNRASVITFCILWFFITILPRASIFISTELVNDYKCYLSSFGVLFFIAILFVYLVKFLADYFEKFYQIKNIKPYSQIILIVSCISSLGFATRNRNFVWSSELLFWEDVVKKTPTKARNFNNYGVALTEAGKIPEAMEVYKKACELDPTYAEPVINLAFHYQTQGKTDLALEHYARALNLREVHPEMYMNLGVLHVQNRSYEKAEICFKTAIKYKPYYSRAYFALAVVYQMQNRLQEALDCYTAGLNGDFQTIEHFYQHGVLAESLNKFNEAIVSLERVKQMDPNYKETAFSLGSCYYNIRNNQKACENFEVAYKKDPKNNIFAYNYAQTLLNLRKFKEALPIFEQCKKDQNALPFAPLHVAKCFMEMGQKNSAKKELRSLIKTTKFEFVKNDGESLLKSLC
jgi:protein O-mannosyl-transferase